MRTFPLILGLAACGGAAFDASPTTVDDAGELERRSSPPELDASPSYVDAAADSVAQDAPGIVFEASDDLVAVPEPSPEAGPPACDLSACVCSPAYPVCFCNERGEAECRGCRFPVDDAGCRAGCTCGG